MAFSNTYTFGFAFTICVVCSLAIASVSIGLRDIQEDNRRRDVQRNILQALGLPEDGSQAVGDQIDALWDERVELRIIDASGRLVEGLANDANQDGVVDQADVELARADAKGSGEAPSLMSVYVRADGSATGAYAIPVYGLGLWGPISGYLALDSRAERVRGATFFAPKETPGLGAEITEPKFKDQWVGKRVVDDQGRSRPIRVVKGQAAVLCPDDIDFCVDGVSGATITSRGVNVMVEQAISAYEPYLKQIRGGG